MIADREYDDVRYMIRSEYEPARVRHNVRHRGGVEEFENWGEFGGHNTYFLPSVLSSRWGLGMSSVSVFQGLALLATDLDALGQGSVLRQSAPS